jgi:hypothetical protein
MLLSKKKFVGKFMFGWLINLLLSKDGRKELLEDDVLVLGNDDSSCLLEDLFVGPSGILVLVDVTESVVFSDKEHVECVDEHVFGGSLISC